MTIDRRQLFIGAGLAALAGPALAGEAAAQAPAPPSDRARRIAELAARNRHQLDHRDGVFSGSAWDYLVSRGQEAQFFLLGEQHGIAENPRFAAALFGSLARSGYTKLAVEISPPMASEIDRALAHGGMAGLRALFADPGARVAFFGMREEAEWLAAARAALPGRRPFLWGLDYEVSADRRLIAMLKARRKSALAERALAGIEAESNRAWARYAETRDFGALYAFAGDPSPVASLIALWPRGDAEGLRIVRTLYQTLAINRLWSTGQRSESNAARAKLMRDNFLAYWRAERAAGRMPRVMMKMGSYHMMRGQTPTDVFDLGTLVPEIAALADRPTFQLFVINGVGTSTAQFDPTTYAYRAAPEDEGHEALAPILGQAYAEGFTLFETAPLRAIARGGAEGLHPDLVRIVHGFDAILLMTGSTPSANL